MRYTEQYLATTNGCCALFDFNDWQFIEANYQWNALYSSAELGFFADFLDKETLIEQHSIKSLLKNQDSIKNILLKLFNGSKAFVSFQKIILDGKFYWQVFVNNGEDSLFSGQLIQQKLLNQSWQCLQTTQKNNDFLFAKERLLQSLSDTTESLGCVHIQWNPRARNDELTKVVGWMRSLNGPSSVRKEFFVSQSLDMKNIEQTIEQSEQALYKNSFFVGEIPPNDIISGIFEFGKNIFYASCLWQWQLNDTLNIMLLLYDKNPENISNIQNLPGLTVSDALFLTYKSIQERECFVEKQSELYLQDRQRLESTELLEVLFEKNYQPNALLQVDSFKIVRTNRAFNELIKFGAQTFDGEAELNVLDLFHEKDRVVFLGTALAQCLMNGHWQGELKMLSCNKQRIDVFVSMSKITSKRQGSELIGISLTDISARKREQSKIEHLALIAERSASIMLTMDSEGKMRWVNSAFSSILNISPSEIIGKDFWSLISSGQKYQIALLKSGIYSGINTKSKLAITTNDGNNLWLEVDLSRFKISSREQHEYLIVAKDITSEYLWEQKMQKHARAISSIQDIVSDQSLLEPARIEKLLRLGMDYFDLNCAYVGVLTSGGKSLKILQTVVRSKENGNDYSMKQNQVVSIPEQLCWSVVQERKSPLVMYKDVQEFGSDWYAHTGINVHPFFCARIDTNNIPYALVAFFDTKTIESCSSLEETVLKMLSQSIALQLSEFLQKNALQQMVQERTKEITTSNEKLTLLVEHLRATKNNIKTHHGALTITSLLSGMAHDLMDPVTNAKLVVDGLQGAQEEFEQLLSNGTLRKSELLKMQLKLSDARQILSTSLTRASELLNNIKSFANEDVEQEEIKSFALIDVLSSLQIFVDTHLKNKCTLSLSCDPKIKLNSYPVSLKKTVISFITFLCGFLKGSADEVPEISLLCHEEKGRVCFSLQSNSIKVEKNIIWSYLNPNINDINITSWELALCASIGCELLDLKLMGSIDFDWSPLDRTIGPSFVNGLRIFVAKNSIVLN